MIIGINRDTLETIREIGSLAETGTTAAAAKEPAKEEPKKPAVSSPVRLTVAPVQVDEKEELRRGFQTIKPFVSDILLYSFFDFQMRRFYSC